MTLETNGWIVILIIVWFATYMLTKYKSNKKFDHEENILRKEYECKISKLDDKLKNSAANYDSLNAKHEELLTRLKNEEERYCKMLDEKYTANRQIAKFQNDLYCARKHAKKLTSQFISILSKLLGTNQN